MSSYLTIIFKQIVFISDTMTGDKQMGNFGADTLAEMDEKKKFFDVSF